MSKGNKVDSFRHPGRQNRVHFSTKAFDDTNACCDMAGFKRTAHRRTVAPASDDFAFITIAAVTILMLA